MAYELKIEDVNRVLKITYTGEINSTDLIYSRKEASLLIRSASLKKILLNFTESKPETTFFELFAFTSTHKVDIPADIKTASIIPEQEYQELYNYVIDSSKSHSNLVSFFHDEESARRWLEE